MTIDCDKPRPRLNQPNRTTPGLAWQPPAFIPQDLAGMQRVLRDALNGIYGELQNAAARRAVVPLLEDMQVRPGQVVKGVADGQVLNLLPPAPGEELDPVTVVLTDVVNPVTVVDPNGNPTTLGVPGVHELVPDDDGDYQQPPGGAGLFGSGVPTDSLVGRDSAGTGEAEAISVGGGLEMTGSQALQRSALTGDVTAAAGSNATSISAGAVDTVELADDAVETAKVANDAITNAKLANVATQTFKGRTSGGTGNPEDLSIAQVTALLGPTIADDIPAEAIGLDLLPQLSGPAVLGKRTGATGDVEALDLTDSATIEVDAGTAGELSFDVVDGSIDTTQLANGAVTNAKIGADAVDGNKIADNAVANEHLQSGSVDTAELVNLAVTTAKLDADAVTGAKIADDAVDTEHIADDAVTSAQVADNAIGTAAIQNTAVTNAKLFTMAQSTIKGRASGAGTGAPTDLTAAQVLAIIESTLEGNAFSWTAGHSFAAAVTMFSSLTLVDPLRLQAIIQPSISSDQDDWNPSGLSTATVVMANVTGTREVTGITAQTLGTVLVVLNVGTGILNFAANGNTDSSPANRIIWANTDGVGLLSGGCAILWYETVNSRWRPIACCGHYNRSG